MCTSEKTKPEDQAMGNCQPKIQHDKGDEQDKQIYDNHTFLSDNHPNHQSQTETEKGVSVWTLTGNSGMNSHSMASTVAMFRIDGQTYEVHMSTPPSKNSQSAVVANKIMESGENGVSVNSQPMSQENNIPVGNCSNVESL